MSYTPDPVDVTNPIDGIVKAATAAPEFRAIKLYMRDVLLAGLNAKAPINNPVFTGRIVGANIHNHPSGASGAQYIASGTYTPTFTPLINVASASAFPFSWLRVGNVVTVSGAVFLTLSGGTTTHVALSFPIASASLGNDTCNGAGFDTVSQVAFAVRLDDGNQRAKIVGSVSGSGTAFVHLTFTYLVT